MLIKRIFLLLGFVSVCAIGLGYGGHPEWWATHHLGLPEPGANLTHMLRAIAGLYVAMGVYWLISAWCGLSVNAALLSIIVFDGGLLIGRLTNLALDTTPSGLFLFYTVFEAVVLVSAVVIWRLPETR